MSDDEIIKAKQLLEAWNDRDPLDVDEINDRGDDLADFLEAACGVSDWVGPLSSSPASRSDA